VRRTTAWAALIAGLVLALLPANSPARGRQITTHATVAGIDFGGYPRQVANRIASHVGYPPGAFHRRQQGKVYVSFTMRPSGHVSGLRVDHSSGVRSLDDAAKAAVRRASPFPRPPDPWKNRLFRLPVHFYQ
jgi:periplasmic protein TonB